MAPAAYIMQPSFLPGAAAGSLDSQRLPVSCTACDVHIPNRQPDSLLLGDLCGGASSYSASIQAKHQGAWQIATHTHTLAGFAIGQAAGLKFMHYGQCHSCQADKLGIVCKGQVLKGYEMEGQTAMEVQEAPNARCSRWILRELLHIFPWPGWLQITRESSAKAAR